MFERFIVGTDLSPATFVMAKCIGDLRKFGAHHCLLVHCVSANLGAAMALSYKTPESFTSEMESQRQILADLGFSVDCRTEFGTPKTRLPEIAVEEDCSLIVLGTQGRTLLADFVLGGTAYGVVSRTRTPVLLLPVKSTPGDDQTCAAVGWCVFTSRVLFATDFSDIADRAFGYVEDMVRATGCPVTLIHVQDKTVFDHLVDSKREDYNRLDGERLQQLKVRLERCGSAEVVTELPIGIPKDAISRYAEEWNASLIVMGTQGRGFLGELTVGSIAVNTARKTSRPILLVPPVRGH